LKIEKIKYTDYVYDIEVSSTHRFFANDVLVHNTDSIFVKIKDLDYEEAKVKGDEIEQYINKFYVAYVKKNYNRKSFLELEFEKIYKKFYMPSVRGSETGAKKRYAGVLENNGKDEIQYVGLEVVRRDWTKLAKKFQSELLIKVFSDKKVDLFVKKFVEDLESGKYDDLLVYKKSIRKAVSEYTKTTPPHIQAARKLGKTDVGTIEYVVTTDGPEPIQKIKHKINYDHYVDKQIKPIANSVLNLLGKNFDDVLLGKQKSLFDY